MKYLIINKYCSYIVEAKDFEEAVNKAYIHTCDDRFLEKLEYLKEINGFKNISETIRKIVEKEYIKEKYGRKD